MKPIEILQNLKVYAHHWQGYHTKMQRAVDDVFHLSSRDTVSSPVYFGMRLLSFSILTLTIFSVCFIAALGTSVTLLIQDAEDEAKSWHDDDPMSK